MNRSISVNGPDIRTRWKTIPPHDDTDREQVHWWYLI
jgi:hypothetical protein